MTDSSSSLLTTHPTVHPQAVTAPLALASPLPNGSLSDTNIQEDEEDYTIKCICIYADDDGNTVFCEKCNTWQHIECYYHGKKVPEEHFCADCFPRDLDAKRATERQRRLREGTLDGGDRKVKRPASKGQKKKHKDSSATIEQLNGWHHHERHEPVNGKDAPPPAKKPKTSHRPSGSIASMNGDSRKRASSNVQSYPSPSKSPQDLFRYPAIPLYTTEFLELYDRDEGHTNAQENEHTVQALNRLSAWRADRSLVVSGPGQQPNAKSPFMRLDRPLQSESWPAVSLETAQKKESEIDGRHPIWRFLRIQSPVEKDHLVGEIRGEVGMLEEYCQQKSSTNRWQELGHPDPFVFFHPHMNIYIDSRKAGTQFRYLRRSCKPNVTLKTFVSEDGECHHCFVASKDIQPGTELTATWYLDPAMLLNGDASKDDPEQLQSRQFDWVSRLLANFGDCACDSGQACLLARFDRRYSTKALEVPTKEKVGRKKRTKHKQAVSPLSTGQATNSRAGSEALKGQDDDEHFDRRSTSESSRSGMHSRDLTPTNQGVLDANPVLGSDLTARELRKIQMLEKTFEQQKSQGPPGQQKKKKRTSGGSTLNTPNVTTSKQLGHPNDSNASTPYNLQPPNRYSDHFTGSPPPPKSLIRSRPVDHTDKTASQPSPSQAQRPEYRSVSIQTDTEEDEILMPPPKRRKFSTPTQRMLRKILADRARHEQPCLANPVSPAPLTASGSAVATVTALAPEKSSIDVEMQDASTGLSPASSKSTQMKSLSPPPSASSTPGPANLPPYSLPSQAAHWHNNFIPPSTAPRLQLSNLPPVPTFSAATSNTTPVGTDNTSALATPSTVQSPLGIVAGSNSYPGLSIGMVTPSPAKKKLSLGDYMSRRNLSATPVIEKTQAQAEGGGPEADSHKPVDPTAASGYPFQMQSQRDLQPSEGIIQEVPVKSGLQGTAIDDRSMKDEPDEPEYVPPDAVPLQEDLVASKREHELPVSTASATAPSLNISPEVSNVLAQLAQLHKARSQSAGS